MKIKDMEQAGRDYEGKHPLLRKGGAFVSGPR